jgi:hypothetical protein
MHLGSDMRQDIQLELDVSSTPTGEARQAGRKETESFPARHGPESPASTNRLMEEICERENLKEETIAEALLCFLNRNRTAETGIVRFVDFPHSTCSQQ